MIESSVLKRLYLTEKLSIQQIAATLDCSANRVVYWMNKHGISRRGISEAIYNHHNPNGDPFTIKQIMSIEQAKLWGIGIGLYWGEGNKKNKYSVRLGNTDPKLLETYIQFLTELCGVNKDKLKFGLQIFSDIDKEEALRFWCDRLSIQPSQFYKITVTISGSIGTYRQKSQYGVVTIYFHNKKLRDILNDMLPT